MSFEYEIRDSLRTIDPRARRSIMSGAIGKTLLSEQGDVANKIGLCIECKRTEKLSPYEFYEQAKSNNSQAGNISIVAMRSNNREALALLSWSDFLLIYQQAMKDGTVYKPSFEKPKGKEKTRKPEGDKVKRLRELREAKYA